MDYARGETRPNGALNARAGSDGAEDMVDLNFIAEARGLCSGQEMRERADRGGETGEWPAANPEGSQSSSRAQFFYVAKPTEEGTKRGGCQVVKGAGLRTLSRRCSRVRLPSPALKQLLFIIFALWIGYL